MNRRSLVALVALVTLSLAFPAAAKEKKIVSGTGSSAAVSTVYSVYPGDSRDHEIRYLIRTDTHTSGEPEWDGATSVIYSLSDQDGPNGTHSGYQIFTHTNGDKSFAKFSGKQSKQPAAGGSFEIHFEGSFEWTGGTGKFEYMRGSGSYKGKVDVDGKTHYTFDGIATY